MKGDDIVFKDVRIFRIRSEEYGIMFNYRFQRHIYICINIYIYTDRQTKNVTGDEVEARKSDKYVKSGVRLEEVQLMTVDRLEWSNFVSEREAPTRISTHSQARHSGFNTFMKELRPGSR